MKTIQKTLGLTALFALALPAFGMIQLDADGNAITKTNVNGPENRIMTLSATTNVENATAVDADMNELTLEAQTQAGVEAQSGMNDDLLDTQDDGDFYMNATVNTDTKTRGKATIVLSAYTAEDKVMLENKAEEMISSDTRISFVSATDNKVEVSYNEPVVVLGLFSKTMERKATAEIDENSEIDVHVTKPWWSFMVTSDIKASADVEADIKAYVEAQATASSQTTVSTYATIMAAIEAGFNSMMDINEQIEAQADTNVETTANVESRLRLDADGNVIDADGNILETNAQMNQKLQAGSEVRTNEDSDIRY